MAWAQGFIDNHNDIDKLAAALHPDYIHDNFPSFLENPPTKQGKVGREL